MAEAQTERVTLYRHRHSGRITNELPRGANPTLWEVTRVIPEDSDQPRLREALEQLLGAADGLIDDDPLNVNRHSAFDAARERARAALEAPPEESWRCPNCGETYPRPDDPGNMWCPGDCGVKLVPPEDSVTGGVERLAEWARTEAKFSREGAAQDQNGNPWRARANALEEVADKIDVLLRESLGVTDDRG